MPRQFLGNGGPAQNTATGVLITTHFTAQRTELCTQIAVVTGNTAAGATPTLCRMGIYSVGSTISLLSACANDTTLFAGTQTRYARSFTTPVLKVAGQRYAAAILIVSAAAIPNFIGLITPQSGYSDRYNPAGPNPMLVGLQSGLSDLPATATLVATQGAPFYAEILP